MQTVDYVLIGVAQIIGVIRQQMAGAICRVGQGLRYRRTNRPELAPGAKFVAKNTQQNAEAPVFHLFVPRRGQSPVTCLDCGCDGGCISMLVHRQENIVALPREVAPAGGTLLVHREGVTIHPEAVQHQVAAQFIPALVFTSLHAPGNLHVGWRFLPEVPPDNSRKLLKGLEYPEVQLREKVTRKDDAAVRVDNKRFQQHWLLFLTAEYPHQILTKSHP